MGVLTNQHKLSMYLYVLSLHWYVPSMNEYIHEHYLWSLTRGVIWVSPQHNHLLARIRHWGQAVETGAPRNPEKQCSERYWMVHTWYIYVQTRYNAGMYSGQTLSCSLPTMLWYGTTINRHKPVYPWTYLHVPLVTILAKSAFQRSAHDIQSIHQYIHVKPLYIMSTPLQSWFR